MCVRSSKFGNSDRVNLDNSKIKINITHAEPVEKSWYGGSPFLYPLANIKEHAERENAILAINGYTWQALDPDGINYDAIELTADNRIGRAVSSLLNQDLLRAAKEFAIYELADKNYGVRPTGTVYSKGKQLHKRSDGIETAIGFSNRTSTGTEADFFDIKNGAKLANNLTHTAENTTTTMISDGSPRDIESWTYWTSSMGIGKFGSNDILVLLSGFNGYSSRLGDHNKIFQSLGVTDAIQLDGDTATSLFYRGSHVNPLPFRHRPTYGTSRKVLYALTVSSVDPIVGNSNIEFYNVTINSLLKFGQRNYFSGQITSQKPLSKITLKVIRPDGVEVVLGEYSQNGITTKDLSEFYIEIGYNIDSLGRYTVILVAEDSTGHTSQREFFVNVILNVTEVTLSPTSPIMGDRFTASVSGEKLDSNIRMTIGTDDDLCSLVNKDDFVATFSCIAYAADRFRLRVYYRDGADYILYEDYIDIAECNAGDEESKSCGSIDNGEYLQTRMCTSNGSWGEYGSCTISCDSGYVQSGNSCILDTPDQICTPNSMETTSCPISNGSGVKTRTCASDGTSWGDYGECKVESCNSGYVVSGNSCVKQDDDETYDFYLSNAQLAKTSVQTGEKFEASVTSNYSGNVLNSNMDSVRLGYYLSTNTSFDSSDVLLGEDVSSLGSDDTSDPESADLTISESTALGSYYILFVTDNNNAFAETNEDNNVEYVSVTVTGNDAADSYDFYITNAELSASSASPSDEVTVSLDVNYRGNVLDADMGSVKTVYFLIQRDQNGNVVYANELGSDFSYLGSDDTSESEKLTFTVPETLPAGSYQILLSTDHDKQYTETNEENNGAFLELEVTGDSNTPSISRLDPSSPKVYPTGSFTRRTAYIYGSNFSNGASVEMCWSTGCRVLNSGFVSGDSYSEVESGGKIKIHFSPGDTPDNWTIVVTNSDGTESNTFRFSTSR